MNLQVSLSIQNYSFSKNKLLPILLVVVLSGCSQGDDSMNGETLLCKETYDPPKDYIPSYKRAGTCQSTLTKTRLFSLDFGYNTVDLYRGERTDSHNYETTVDSIKICLEHKSRDMNKCTYYRIDILRQDGRGFYKAGGCPIQCEKNSNATKVVSDAHDVIMQREERRKKRRLEKEKQDEIDRQKINERIREDRKF